MVARKLPSDLEEEILVRVPPLSLVRFRSVCKEWNTLFKNKRFVNKNFALARPEFMLKTHSHIYSISVNLNEDPTIKVRDLRFGLRGGNYWHFGNCDGYFFMYDFYKGGVVWNPLLRHTKWVAEAKKSCGKSMGYDSSRQEKSYKIIGIWSVNQTMKFEVSEFATKRWKVTDHHTSYLEMSKIVNESSKNCGVSLNGNLYWPARNEETGEYFIGMLDYSKEIRKPFCNLPCKPKKKFFTHSRVLALYKGDRFSVLEQCERRREIEIWVTKKKIGNGDDVVWIKFMNIAIPNFPIVCHMSSSYFVDNNIYGKTCVVCCPSKKPKEAWIYIVRGDVCKKIKIDGVACKFQSSVYVPSLITIP